LWFAILAQLGMKSRLKLITDWLPLARRADWSVSQLAKLCGVSVRGLERHFQETHGQKPKAWLAAQRQRLALELLCDGSTFKETVSLLGYLHGEHFSRDFKTCHGFCPTERCDRCGRAGTCLKLGSSRLA
jgi:AraC-like DNA-binding protein